MYSDQILHLRNPISLWQWESNINLVDEEKENNTTFIMASRCIVQEESQSASEDTMLCAVEEKIVNLKKHAWCKPRKVTKSSIQFTILYDLYIVYIYILERRMQTMLPSNKMVIYSAASQ